MCAKKNVSCLCFKTKLKSWKASYSFNDSKQKKWHYLAVNILSALLKGITSKKNGGFYCLNCLHSFRTKEKLESHRKVWENKDFCKVIMPSEDTKILGFNQYKKSYKVPFVIYADLECITEKTDGCKNNPENSSTTKVSQTYSFRVLNAYNIFI